MGLIVSKAVGNAVVRNRVARRLRAVCAAEISTWEAGDLVVVRALPAAGAASSAALASDLHRAAARVGLAGEAGTRP